LGLSLEEKGLTQYVAEGHAPFPVYMVRSQDVMQKLSLSGTPEMIVIAPGARVERVWQGAFTGGTQKEIQDFFGVQLPGLSFAAASHP
jgi:hypothetical protein